MSYAKRHRISVTTDTDGDATKYTPVVSGIVSQIVYTKPASGGLDTATFAITGETTGVSVWSESGVNASKTVVPTQPATDQAGTNATYDGTRVVRAPIYLAQERVKIVISNAGSDNKGTFDVIVTGPTG